MNFFCDAGGDKVRGRARRALPRRMEINAPRTRLWHVKLTTQQPRLEYLMMQSLSMSRHYAVLALVLSGSLWWVMAALVSVLALSGTAAAAPRQYGLGLILESDEVYRTFTPAPHHRAFLPPAVDLSARFPTPGQQGAQSSCVAWALAYAVLSYHTGKQHGWQFTSPERLFSPAYLYNQIVQGTGNCDRGSRMSEALRLLQQDGVASLAQFPYDASDCTRLPTPEVRAASRGQRVRDWQVIEPGQLDDIKGQLYKGHPVVFGMAVSEAFLHWQGSGVYDDRTAPRTLGHAMVFVGYDEQRQAFRALNSWGTGWGDQGFVWIHNEVVRQYAKQMYVIDVGVPPVPALAPSPTGSSAPLTPPPQALPPTAPVEPMPPPGPVPPSSPTLAVLRTQVDEQVRQVECSRLAATIALDRAVRLQGFVGSRPHLDALLRGIARLPGISAVGDEVTVRPWPQCEAYLTFGDLLAAPQGLAMHVRGGETLSAGDLLVLELTTPTFPSYLYVTYLQASGEAVHLAWPRGKAPQPVPPNTRVVFGDPSSKGVRFRIQPPLGDEMLIALASATPLFTGDPTTITGDRNYLTAWRQTLLKTPPAGGWPPRLAGVAVPLSTKTRH